MLVKGNTKLGNIYNWSIPAIDSCVGSTELCRNICYACRGAYRFKSVDEAHMRNWVLSRTRHFVSSMVAFIWRKQIGVVRIHAAGDFDKVSYVRRWREIIKACPDTQFYAYTRSWRKTDMTPIGLTEGLRELALLPNMRLWLSCDRQTGRPPRWRRAPTAWLMLDDNDLPPYRVELAFRDSPDSLMMSAPQVDQVCPYEMRAEKMKVSCESCKICFSGQRKVLKEFDSSKAAARRRGRKGAVA